MRRFNISRLTDITGMSGTGYVAEGVEFSDGRVAVRWLQASDAARTRGVKPTTTLHDDIESVSALHGHDGATEVVWID